MNKLAAYWRLGRPFTLIMPPIGMISGALVAIGAHKISGEQGLPLWDTSAYGLGWRIAAGATLAATLNIASNTINQIYDLDIDRVNKPDRPIPSGVLSIREAAIYSGLMYLISLALAFALGIQTGVLVSIAAVCTWLYSAPPARTKQHYATANFTVAFARGLLLKVAGWASVRSMMAVEPWFIGSIFFLFLLGATSIKDFADVDGDRAFGCRTLPVVFGLRAATWIMAPFYVLPFLLLPIGVMAGILHGSTTTLYLLGATMILWGVATIVSLLWQPDFNKVRGNHPAWTGMYLMMLTLQVGMAVAYFPS